MKSNLKNRFGQLLQQRQLLQLGDRVLVAVSGGADSVVLLHLLLQWQRRFKLSLGVVHLNHQLRGKAAEKDAQFVSDLAGQHNLPFFLCSENISRYAGERKMSLEQAGHQVRRELFEQVAGREGFTKIATGHHSNDQAETVLMRLISGSGIAGMAGIRRASGMWVRPLLFAERYEILQYAAEKNIIFREDASNQDERFERNKIRHRLLPCLAEEYNPQITSHLSRIADRFAEWDQFQQQTLQAATAAGEVNVSQNKISVEMTAFQGYFSWFKMYLIQQIVSSLNLFAVRLNSEKMDAFFDWTAKAENGSQFNWGNNFRCLRNENRLLFEKIELSIKSPIHIRLENEAVCRLSNGHKVDIKQVKRVEMKFGVPGVEFVDGEKLHFPLTVRIWQPGDKIKPLGMAGKKLVSDFLTDKKISGTERNEILLLLSGKAVVAILGHRISEDFKVNKETQKIYKIIYE